MDDLKSFDLSSLRKIYSGGALSTPELVRSVYDKIRVQVRQRLRLFRGNSGHDEARR